MAKGKTEAEGPVSERRASVRVRLEVDVTITSPAQEFKGVSQNISASGLFVATLRILPVGTQVSVKFALPSGTVMAKGRVARLRQASDGVTPGLAVIFEGLDELDRDLIAQFCGDERLLQPPPTR